MFWLGIELLFAVLVGALLLVAVLTVAYLSWVAIKSLARKMFPLVNHRADLIG